MRNRLNLKRSDIVKVSLLKTANVDNNYVGTSTKLVEFLSIDCLVDAHKCQQDEKVVNEVNLITSVKFIDFRECTHFRFNNLTYKIKNVENLEICTKFKGSAVL